jgi:putative membrane protein
MSYIPTVPGQASPSERWALRAAGPLFWAHTAIILFSTAALVTILAGPPPDWLATEPNATIYRLGWKFSGPSYVVLGALAALAHAAGTLGWKRAIALLLIGSVISLSSELLGTSTGLPFGDYQYTGLLGYRIAGLVPFPIPLSWFLMIYASLAICGRILPASDDRRGKWRWAVLAGGVLVAWDVAMDPAMSAATKHWLWRQDGFFYGMPLINWFGWFITGVLVARTMLMVAPPTAFATRVSPARLPIALYAVNGIMPIAMVARAGMWWAFGLGLIAMGIPVWLALQGRLGHRTAGRQDRVLADVREA